MTFQQLAYAAEAARQGSINKAAARLFVSQSAVSHALKELEEELGVTLFRRNSRGVTPTADGREFLACVKSIEDQKEQLQSMFRVPNAHPARLSVSTQRYPFAVDAFVRLLHTVEDQRYRFHIKETGMNKVIRDVAEGESDLGVIFLSAMTEKFIRKVLAASNIAFHELCRVEPHVFIRKDHPLAAFQRVESEQMRAYPYLAFDQDYGVPPDYSEEMNLFSVRDPDRVIYIYDRATAYNVLTHTDAFTIGSGVLVPGFVDERLLSVPLGDAYDTMRLGWIDRREGTLSKEGLQFLSLLQDAIDDAAERER